MSRAGQYQILELEMYGTPISCDIGWDSKFKSTTSVLQHRTINHDCGTVARREQTVVKPDPRYLPAAVAAANNLVVAVIVWNNQPGHYPTRLLAVQIAIVVACLLLASRNLWVRSIGFALTLVGIVLSFSAMFLYAPTFVAALWLLISRRGLEPPN